MKIREDKEAKISLLFKIKEEQIVEKF